MHAGPEEKNYLERFYFRAPPVGTGPITFRALVKQGETNKGAFYWPVAPASATPDLTPVDGRSNGDLTLTEGSPRAPTPWSYRGSVGETCTQVCARYSGMVCDEAALSATDTPVELSAAVASSFVCALPLLATCGSSAPRMSGLGDGLCWYREDTCAARPSLACDATPPADFESGLRLCPCVPPSGRRRLDVNNTSDGSGGDAAKRPSGLQELPDYKEFDINADGRPVHRPRVDDINDDSVLHVLEAEAELAAPCEPSPADALLSLSASAPPPRRARRQPRPLPLHACRQAGGHHRGNSFRPFAVDLRSLRRRRPAARGYRRLGSSPLAWSPSRREADGYATRSCLLASPQAAQNARRSLLACGAADRFTTQLGPLMRQPRRHGRLNDQAVPADSVAFPSHPGERGAEVRDGVGDGAWRRAVLGLSQAGGLW